MRRGNNGYPAAITTTTTTSTPSSPAYTHTHRRPTKPAYAYGYGEKPYRSQDAPIFRHFETTTTPKPKPVINQPVAARQYRPNVYASNSNPWQYKKDVNPLYNPRSYRPSAGYYQTYRNVSATNVAQTQDLDKELPVLTQPDTSGRGNYDNIIPNTVLDEKKQELVIPKVQKPPRSTIDISKRGGGEKPRNYVTNGRLKYSLENKDADEVYVNTSGRYTPSPLSIALLPYPEADSAKSSKAKKVTGKFAKRNEVTEQKLNTC